MNFYFRSLVLINSKGSARMRYITVLIILFFLGCKTEQGGEGMMDGTSLPGETIDQENLSTSVVPLSLWSPQQRQATAGFYFLVAEKAAYVERDAKRALKLYDASYNLDPNSFLGGKMVGAKAAAGEKEEAIVDARKMVLLYPKDHKLRYLFGRLLVEMGDFEESEKQLEIALELKPDFEPPYLELMQLHQRRRDTTKSFLIAKELTKHIPSSIHGWTTLSRYYLSKNQHKKALPPAKRAFLMAPANPTVTQIYAILLQLNGKKKQAVHIYEELYKLNPADEQLTAQMVDLYRELGDLEEALILINEMLASSKKESPGIEMQKAIILWELKKFEEAAELLVSLSNRHPESDRLKYMAAVSLERKKNYKKSIKSYELINPNSTFYYRAMFRIVIIHSSQKEYKKAIKAGRDLVELPESDWESWRLLGGIYADEERFAEAVEVFSEGLKKYPKAHRLRFLKGVYQEKAKDIPGCIKTMRLVIENDPANSSAYNYLGYLFAERGENLDEAEKLIKKALELKPNDGFYLDSLGWVYYQMGKPKKAQPFFEKALKVEPKEGVIMEHLADVIRKIGNLKKAKKVYLEALKVKISAQDRKRVEGKIEEIKTKGK
jgi:tetratricopeptide (TPR) repeat protein